VTSHHPQIPYDVGLIEEIAARMDLRTPNREALEEVAKRFDAAAGAPFEAVCDVATAVGKTWLAGGLIEYLAASGVRHFLIVVPGRTILDKTVANLTAGHPKSILGGMESEPLVITADNFNTGAVGAALHDENQVKVLVFTVQSLIKPKKNDKRTRKHQEWLGEDLYQYLRNADDLVVIADEHHWYSEKAKAFFDTVRDLDPMGLVGLTATPAKSDLDKVVYRYPLARAIADGYVKTPVLVGRKDDASGVETQLRDGLLLLEAKQKAADAYSAAIGLPRVNAVMFVVADTIDNANAVAEVLRKPGLFHTDYEQRVLVIHSQAPDDALARLEAVEDPDSPVRVIVSVSMLKEGWDVKNIYVICSFRPSISETLTEQTLGRGLRLPWGAYTGVELLDTVEVLSHERYKKLLEQAGVLLKGLTQVRSVTPVLTPAAHEPDGDPIPASTDVDEPPPEASDTVLVTPAVSDPAPSAPTAADPVAPAAPGGPGSSEEPGAAPAPLGGLLVSSMEERSTDAGAQAEAVKQPVKPTSEIVLPKVVRTVTARSFSLSDVPDEEFTKLGEKLAAAAGTTLERKRLDVIADPTAPSGYRLVPTDATETIAASTPSLPYGNAKVALQEAILGLDVVETSKASLNAAKRLAQAVVDGAGTADALASYLTTAIHATARIINARYRRAPEVVDMHVESTAFAPVRLNDRPAEPNRYGKFSKRAAYSGWQRSQHPLVWFDTTPERDLALLADAEENVSIWTRIQRGELVIEWTDGRYSPDFYVHYDQIHYLLEVKADKDVADATVQAKKAAAEKWARYVTDHGDHGTWRYLLVPQSVVNTAKTLEAVIGQTAA
jgi:type III restriction enzyme